MLQRNGRLLYKRFAGYFFPTILMAMALSMSVVVDGIIVGNMLGPEALAAVNLALPLTLGFCIQYCLFGVGGSVLVAYYKGRRDNVSADAVFSVSVLCLILSALATYAVCVPLLEELAGLLSGGNEALQGLVLRFIEPLVYACPLFIVIPGLVYLVRTDGQPRLASAVLVTANVINLGCDILFIHLMGDVRGASLATVTGYVLGSCLLFLYVRSKRRGLHFVFPLRGFFRQAAGIAKAGLTSGLSMALQFLKIFCINSLVLSVAGKTGMVAFSVCLSCLSLAAMFISGASQTMMPIIGVLSGEGDYKGIRFVYRRALIILLGSAVALVLLLELFPEALLGLFGVSAQEDLAVGVSAIRMFAPSFLGTAFTFLMITYAQTVRRQGMAVALTVIQGFAVVVPAAWLLSGALGLSGIWLSFSVAEIVGIVAVIVMTRRVVASSDGKLHGLLMLPEGVEGAVVLDVTIPSSVEEAVSLSETVTRFCRENGAAEGVANRVGMAVEEMAVNTAKHGGAADSSYIDVSVSIVPGSIRVSFRDDGRPFNPLEYAADENEGLTFGGIALIRKMAERMEYTYALGFNNTVIAVKTA